MRADRDELERIAHSRTAHHPELRRAALHLTFDESEEVLPAAVGVADRVIEQPIRAGRDDLESIAHPRPAHHPQLRGATLHPTISDAEEVFPSAVCLPHRPLELP